MSLRTVYRLRRRGSATQLLAAVGDALDTAVHAMMALILAFALGGIPLAMLGIFEPLPVAVATVSLWVLFYGLSRHATVRADRSHVWPLVAVVVFVIGSTAFNARFAAQHVVVDRDPGVYVITGLLIAQEGGLLFESPSTGLRAHSEVITEHTGYGFAARQDGEGMYAQFLHLLPAVLATAEWAGGLWLVTKANPVLAGAALLMFFAFAGRIMRPWFAALATVLLAATLPFTYFARDTYSELLTIVFLMGGLWMLAAARSRLAVREGLVAGLLLGATCMTRVDSFLYLPPLVLYLCYELTAAADRDTPERRAIERFVASVGIGAGLTAGIGLADGLLFSPIYIEDHQDQLLKIGLAFGAAVIVGVTAVMLRRQIHSGRQRLGAMSPVIANVVAAGIVSFAAWAYFVRPSVSKAVEEGEHWDGTTTAHLQASEGVPVEPGRTYAEATLVWLEWYLGPLALIAGVLGAAFVARRLLLRPDSTILPFALIFAATAVVYLTKPSIYPDQIWASRRLLPVIIPGFVLLSCWFLDSAWQRLTGTAPRQKRLTTGIGLGLVVAMIAMPASRTTAIATRLGPQVPMAYEVDRLCAALPADALVALRSDENLQNTFIQTVHAACRVPVVVPRADADLASYRELERIVSEGGRRLYVVSRNPEPFGTGPGIPTPQAQFGATYPALEQTLTRPPKLTVSQQFQVFLTPLTPG